MSIKLLLDNADTQEWERWSSFGIFHGITTNPNLFNIANEELTLNNLENLSKKAENFGYQEIHLQAWGESSEERYTIAQFIASLSTQRLKVYTKLPITLQYTKVARKLIQSNLPLTFTACYEAKQIIIASAIGASYIAPYLGRINDEGRDGLNEIIKMQEILDGIESTCQILVASIRDSREICHLASHGIKTFTINSKIAEDLFKSESTLKALKEFQQNINK